MAMSMTVTAALPAAAAGLQENAEGTAEAAEELTEGRIWETDIEMGIARENELIHDAGMQTAQWDEAVAERKQLGLAASLTEEMILAADPETKIDKDDKGIYFIGENKELPLVKDALDAYQAVYGLVDMLGGSELTDLRLWWKMVKNDLTVYSFQQVSDGAEVIASTVKIAVHEDGTISAVFSSLDGQSAKEETIASGKEAEDAVLAALESQGIEGNLLREYTERTIYYPITMADLNMDIDEEENIPKEVLWVVYSENEGDDAGEYPFLANYVSLDGTYQYTLPVREPQDEESRSGYRKQDVFAGMTAASWTGELTREGGQKRSVTLPVMYDEAEGMYYLGDVERRIAVADFKEAVYGEDHSLNLIGNQTNDEWDNEDLYMYYNYLRAWEFYADMGWIGPNGEPSDAIILKDICSSDGVLIPNAASAGRIENYQVFAYTAYDDLGQPFKGGRSLDVVAHEYTHNFTGNVWNSELYENDFGAINEAMSDIMGNLVEYICKDTEDTKWKIGENAGMEIRCMSDPNFCSQPGYVWDVFYGPNVEHPNTANDNGGVHGNSSLLNRIAALLCLDHGMSYEEAVSFWLTVEMGMTAGTGYPRIGAVLDWAIEESGNAGYKEALDGLIAEEYLDRTEVPETIPATHRHIRLKLPETEAFEDENWALIAIQLDQDVIGYLGLGIVGTVRQMFEDSEDFASFIPVLQEMVKNLRLDGNQLKVDHVEDLNTFADAFSGVFIEAIKKVLVQSLLWKPAGSDEIEGMLPVNPTVYALINVTQSGTKMNGIAVLIGDQWFDLGGAYLENYLEKPEEEKEGEFLDAIGSLAELFKERLSEKTDENKDAGMLDKILNAASQGLKVIGYFISDEEDHPSLRSVLGKDGGGDVDLPTKGLELVQLYPELNMER